MKKLLLCLLVAWLVACGGAETDLSTYNLPESVEVTFNVLLPETSPVNEPAVFAILDEVTGLAFNPQHMEMDRSGESSYSVSVRVPTGTLLKYRYARQTAAGNVDEIDAGGQPVLFRAFLVDGPGHVAHDLIAAWADLPTTRETGQVSGSVTESGSGNVFANIVVVVAGKQTRTDVDGRFVITGLPEGLQNIVAYAEDGTQLPFQQGALVAANSDTPANLQLLPNLMAEVFFIFAPPEDHTAGVPIYVAGNIGQLAGKPALAALPDGRYGVTLQLPTGVDIRYKYTLGDGFWNAEHDAEGAFLVRQLIIPAGTTHLTIEDQSLAWTSEATAPIWFQLTAPDPGGPVYIQFKLLDWGLALPMWPLGAGNWAYKLYSPTNFSAPLEYRYCLDAACSILEAAPGLPRAAQGNQASVQIIEDRVDAWQGQ
ncbi:MAG: hypothetical protein WEC37_00835 [Anaerolineales bacterium]